MVLAGGAWRRACDDASRPEACTASATREGLERTIRVLHAELFAVAISARGSWLPDSIRIAAKGAIFRAREIEVDRPVLEKLRAEGMRLTDRCPRIRCSFRTGSPGPMRARDVSRSGPARAQVRELRRGINVTARLPMVRTSSTTAPRSSSPAPVGQSPGSPIEAVEAAIRNGASRDADGA